MLDETIEIKFRFPFVCYLRSFYEQELDFCIEFVEGDFCVKATLEISEPLTPKVGEFKGQYLCTSQNIQFHLRSSNFLETFQQPIDELRNNDSFKQKIYEISIKVLNRVLRNLRVYGLAPHIYEQTSKIQDAEVFLWHWNTQFRIGTSEWLTVFDKDKVGVLDLFAAFTDTRFGSKTPEIDTVFTRDIIEAIEDNLEPPPEQEFWVNSLEFLHDQNFRMAVVESVIGLEIALTQYISVFLEKKKGLSQTKINNFVGEVGLKNRFDIVLKLLAEEKDFASVNLDIVLETIGWRNKVTHKGKLPEEIPASKLRLGIASVVEVSQILRLKIHQIDTEPMFQTIVEKVKQKCGSTSVCWIFPITRRKIYMDLSVLVSPNWFTRQNLEEIIKFTIELIRAEIPRFDPQKDLYAKLHHFSRLQPVAIYAKGELKILQTHRQSIESDSFIT